MINYKTVYLDFSYDFLHKDAYGQYQIVIEPDFWKKYFRSKMPEEHFFYFLEQLFLLFLTVFIR